MPGEHRLLRVDGDIPVLLEEHDTGGEIRLDVIDRCHPDRDGYYSVGAHLWFWHDSDTAIPGRDRMRAGLTALAGRARTVLTAPPTGRGRTRLSHRAPGRRPPVAPQRRARRLPTSPTPHEPGPCPSPRHARPGHGRTVPRSGPCT